MIDKSTYRRFRQKADRIVKNEEVGLTEEEQLDLLRMAHELELAYIELEAQNKQLQKIGRELEDSRNEYLDLFESAPVALVSLSPTGIIERINSAAVETLSGSADTIIGSNFIAMVPTEDLNTWFRHSKNITPMNRTRFFELRLGSKDRHPIRVHIQAAPKFNADKKISHWLLAIIDVTEKREHEKQLQQLHQQLEMASRAAQIGVWNFDLESGTSRWNEKLYRLLGLEPRQGPEPAERFFEFIHPDDRQGTIESLQHVLNQRTDEIAEEFRVIKADGSICWLASRGRIFRDQRGRPARIAGINYDITDRKEVEETVQLAQAQMVSQMTELERANQELSEYAYAVSHDLKGPLRAIHNYVDFLYEDLAGSLTGDQKKYLEGMKRAVNQGNALIEDLLNFSRIGREPLEMEPADVPALVAEVRSLLGVPPEVEVDVEPRWPEFSVDHILLKQILQNLISNAIKFNHSRPKRIEISWQPAPDDLIEIFVRDNGIGMAPQYTEQVFRIFQRLHSHEQFDGTGIGLAIVQKAAFNLGGAVRLESEPGQGSTFVVTLPREPGDPGQ